MAAHSTTAVTQREGLYAFLGGASGLAFALALASSPLMGFAIAAGAALLYVGLFAPAMLLLAWIGTGPTLSTWLDVSVGPVNLTPERAVLTVLFSLSVWRWLRRPHTLLPFGRLELLMAWFIVYAAASTLAGGGTQQTNLAVVNVEAGGLRLDFVFLVLTYGFPFLGFFLVKNLLCRESDFRRLLLTFVAVGVFVAATGILQYYTSITWFTPTRMDVIHEGRATGTMSSAPEFGLVVGIPLLVAVVCFLRSRSAAERFLLAAAIPVMGVAIVLAKTRVIWLGVAVGLAVAAWYEPRLRRHLIAAGLVATLGLMAAWPLLEKTEFIRGRVLDMTPIYTRVVTTATTLNMFAHSPLFGYGFGRYTYDSEKWAYVTGIGSLPSYFAYPTGVPHNEYMHVLVLLGLVGFVPYIAILVLAWRTASRHYRERFDLAGPRRDIGLIVLTVMGLYLTTALTVDAFAFGSASIQVYALLGALDGIRVRDPRVSPELPRLRRARKG